MTELKGAGEVQWVVACISPGDVAPHPNFRIDKVRGSELLALLVQLQYFDYREYRKSWNRDPHDDRFPEQVDSAHELLDAAEIALDSDTAEEGTRRLVAFAKQVEVPMGQRAAAALIAGMTASEVDRLDWALELLDRLLEEFPSPAFASATSGVVEATLCLQAAVRYLENGDVTRANECAYRAQQAASVTEEAWDEFNTSKGILWSPAESQRRIAELISGNAQSFLITTAAEVPTFWADLVRSSPPLAEVRPTKQIANSFVAAVDRSFREKHTGRVHSQSFFRDGDPIINPLWASLTHAELSGSLARTAQYRDLLGKSLALWGGVGLTEKLVTRESVRLLRQADSEDALRNVLYTYRVLGPLDALCESAERVVSRRARPTPSDLALIEMCADLLSEDQLNRAVILAFQYEGEGSDGRLGRHRRHDWRRAETALKTVAATVSNSSNHQYAAEVALALARSHSHGYVERFISALAALSGSVKWEQVSRETTAGWIDLLTQLGRHETVPPVQLALMWEAVNGSIDPGVMGRLIGLARVAAVLNGWLGSPPKLADLRIASDACASALREMLADANGHRHSLGVFSPTELSAHMIVRFDQKTLWLPLLDVLRHDYVPIMEKLPALRVLLEGSASAHPTTDAERAIADIGMQLRDPLPQAALNDNSPGRLNVAWLGLAGAHGLVSRDRLNERLLRYAATPDPDVRSETAQAISALARGKRIAPENVSLLLQLSYDVDGTVRHHSARGLALADPAHTQIVTAVRDRLRELLHESGISAALGALRGLIEVAQVDRSRAAWCDDEVRHLERTHPSRNIRDAARTFFSIGSRRADP